MAIQPLTMYMQGKRGFVEDKHVFNTEPKDPVGESLSAMPRSLTCRARPPACAPANGHTVGHPVGARRRV